MRSKPMLLDLTEELVSESDVFSSGWFLFKLSLLMDGTRQEAHKGQEKKPSKKAKGRGTMLKTGKEVRKRRLALGITTEELAREMKIETSLVFYIETQGDGELYQDDAQKVSEALATLEQRGS